MFYPDGMDASLGGCLGACGGYGQSITWNQLFSTLSQVGSMFDIMGNLPATPPGNYPPNSFTLP